MPFTAYVSLRGGGVAVVTGVTALPDLVAKPIKSGWYRDMRAGTLVPASQTVAAVGSGSPQPQYVVGTIIPYEHPDDITHTSPRQLSWEESYWEFTVSATEKYYFPAKDVLGWGNAAPVY